VTRMAGHQWTDTQCAIPQAGMMSTYVTNIHQRMKPGNEYSITHSKGGSDITLGNSRIKVLIENRHGSERSNLQGNPTGWQRCAVFLFECTYKLFVAALIFIANTGQRLIMLVLIAEQRCIFNPIATFGLGHHIGHLGSHSNLNMFDTGHYKMAQVAVKLVKHTGLFKCASRFEDVVVPICQKRIPIAAHTIIANFVKPRFCLRLISYYHSTLFQNLYLIGIGLDLFGVRDLTHDYIIIIKKAYPKRAGLWEAG